MDQDTTQQSKPKVSSFVWAVLIALAIGGWLLSGQYASDGQATHAVNTDTASDGTSASKTAKGNTDTVPLFEVRTRIVSSEPRNATLVIRGETKATAEISVRAETSGVVEMIANKKGQHVKKGALLCKLDIGAREAAMLQARAERTKAEADYKASSRLARNGHTSKLKLASDMAALDAAKAAYTRARIDLENIEITAPIDGIIESQPAKTGDFLRPADVCATMVDVDPILLTGAVSERDITKIRNGMTVTADLVTGERVEGTVTFISSTSDQTTKTFTFEARVPNTDRSIRAGITANITIPLAEESAHRVASSYLTLDDGGRVGLRIVNQAHVVRFVPVTVLSNENNALWVAGLPNNAQVITVGQEYVVDGQKVRPVLEQTEGKSTLSSDTNQSTATQ